MISSIKKTAALLLSLTMLAGLTACASQNTPSTAPAPTEPAAAPVNLASLLKEMSFLSTDLGLEAAPEHLDQVQGGAIDPELVGTWITADGDTTYSYDAEGKTTAVIASYGIESEAPYTTLTAGGQKVVVEELSGTSYADGKETAFTQVSYSVYRVDNDALYMVPVSTPGEYMTSFASSVIVFYRADENGSTAAARAKHSVDPASFYGSWANMDETKGGEVTIDEKGFAWNGSVWAMSLDEGRLILEKDGVKTAYSCSLARLRNYEDDTLAKLTGESLGLSLSYTGQDEKDVPNLGELMTDYKTEYGYDQWYYSCTLSMPLQ